MKQKTTGNLNFWVTITEVTYFGHFEDYSILAEKQRLKPKNSNSLKFFASFDTLLDPRGAKVVETNFTSKIALFEMI